MNYETIAQVIKRLEELKDKKAAIDDKEFNVYDYSVGNYDDAYYQGSTDGEILLARELAEILGVR